MSRKEFHFNTDVIDALINTLKNNGLYADRTPSDEPVIDPKDVVFYEVALSKGDAYLVTGNLRHFPQKPIVVTPAEMIQILENNGLIEKEEI